MGRRLSILLVITLLGVWPNPVSAQTPEGLTAVITFPAEGQQLFGLVNILGSAQHSTAFNSFTLEYNNLGDLNAPWLLVQPRVQQQVHDGVLGTWNTNVVPDGTYQLRLRVYLDDNQVGEFVVSNLKVVNSEPTPVPTAQSDTGGGQPGLEPTFGPSPTSPVVQPPSNSPSISGLSGPDSADTGAPTAVSAEIPVKKTTRVNVGRVRSAFCTGVYLTFAIFAIMLGYSLVRGRLRPFTRRLMWQSQDDWPDQDQPS